MTINFGVSLCTRCAVRAVRMATMYANGVEVVHDICESCDRFLQDEKEWRKSWYQERDDEQSERYARVTDDEIFDSLAYAYEEWDEQEMYI